MKRKNVVFCAFGTIWFLMWVVTPLSGQQQPYRLLPALDVPLNAGSFSGVAWSYRYQQRVLPLDVSAVGALSRSEVGRFDRGATYRWSVSAARTSDVLAMGCLLAPLTLTLADPQMRRDVWTVGVMGMQTFALTAFVTNTTKASVRRTRPFVYNPEAPLPAKLKVDARMSFFSGHTSMAACMSFFAAQVYSDYHPNSHFRPYVWAAAAVLPAAVGFYRYRAGKHFPTDVITGYAVGAAFGVLVPALHRRLN